MTLPDLSTDELRRCAQACTGLRLPPRMGRHFRGFLAGALAARWPALAGAIARCGDAQLAALYDHLRRLEAGPGPLGE